MQCHCPNILEIVYLLLFLFVITIVPTSSVSSPSILEYACCCAHACHIMQCHCPNILKIVYLLLFLFVITIVPTSSVSSPSILEYACCCAHACHIMQCHCPNILEIVYLLLFLFVITIVPTSSVSSPSISNLTILRFTDQNGQDRTVKVLEKISPSWEELGDLLGLTSEHLKGIELNRRRDIRMCCRDVLVDWLHENQCDYPTTWEGVLHLLEDLELSAIAYILKKNFNLSGLEHGMLCLLCVKLKFMSVNTLCNCHGV